jgi:hypothetical protein
MTWSCCHRQTLRLCLLATALALIAGVLGASATRSTSTGWGAAAGVTSPNGTRLRVSGSPDAALTATAPNGTRLTLERLPVGRNAPEHLVVF